MEARFPRIDFFRAAGMRNILVHEYDNVDPEVVHVTARKNVAELIPELRHYLGLEGVDTR